MVLALLEGQPVHHQGQALEEQNKSVLEGQPSSAVGLEGLEGQALHPYGQSSVVVEGFQHQGHQGQDPTSFQGLEHLASAASARQQGSEASSC